MCIDDQQQSMILVTGSSNYGHAICCKPDYFGEDCNSDGRFTCSEPAFALDTKSKYKDILTDGMLNHQMFAFMPKTNAYLCGISDITSSTF